MCGGLLGEAESRTPGHVELLFGRWCAVLSRVDPAHMIDLMFVTAFARALKSIRGKQLGRSERSQLGVARIHTS